MTVTVERVLGSMNVIMALDGAPGTEIRITPAEVKGAEPGKLIIRLKNRLSGLESLRSRSLSEIDQLTVEAAHARDDIARPFQGAEQLAAARDRVARLDDQLRQTAAPPQRNGDDGLVAAAMHDAAVMAGIPGPTVVVTSHQNGQLQSAVQVSRSDFPMSNPLVGTAPAAEPTAPKLSTQAPRVISHMS